MVKTEIPSVAIIDYGMSNLFSVHQACLYVGLSPIITNDPEVIAGSSAVILPGVGAFQYAMKQLEQAKLVEPIKEFVSSGKPFMGICLGMQLLFSESDEFGTNKGLGIIEGNIRKFENSDDSKERFKVPQISWNTIQPAANSGINWKVTPLNNINEGAYMYFVHSFYAFPSNPKVELSTTEYGGKSYCSSVLADNVFATQFHPEKSAQEGLKIYENWANYVRNSR